MFTNMNPNDLPLWPALFITIACGAISGFHATPVSFDGALYGKREERPLRILQLLIGEGIIALIWCAHSVVLLVRFRSLSDARLQMVSQVTWLYWRFIWPTGCVGGILAFLGVVMLPITSGDTAFRSSRLILAIFDMEQKTLRNRLLMALPLFVLGGILTQVDFGIIWRYFGFANQSTAVMMLWTLRLLRHNKLRGTGQQRFQLYFIRRPCACPHSS